MKRRNGAARKRCSVQSVKGELQGRQMRASGGPLCRVTWDVLNSPEVCDIHVVSAGKPLGVFAGRWSCGPCCLVLTTFQTVIRKGGVQHSPHCYAVLAQEVLSPGDTGALPRPSCVSGPFPGGGGLPRPLLLHSSLTRRTSAGRGPCMGPQPQPSSSPSLSWHLSLISSSALLWLQLFSFLRNRRVVYFKRCHAVDFHHIVAAFLQTEASVYHGSSLYRMCVWYSSVFQ